jgi:DNA-binding transcriptional LysR family regulator
MWHKVQDLNGILIFASVAETGSFTAAARTLALPKSTVSRKVLELEKRVGARLIQRTTRTLSLTDVGRVYYEHCARISREADEADLAVQRMQATPRGVLRITAPLSFRTPGRIAAEFLKRYPDVRIEVVCTDRPASRPRGAQAPAGASPRHPPTSGWGVPGARHNAGGAGIMRIAL